MLKLTTMVRTRTNAGEDTNQSWSPRMIMNDLKISLSVAFLNHQN